MYKSIVCRYHEIATKGHNRSMFENKLITNMRILCEYDGIAGLVFQRIRGRIFIRKLKNGVFSSGELEKVKDVLSRSFGLESFSPVIECEPDINRILDIIGESAKETFEEKLKTCSVVQFRTRARRSDKTFPLRSKEIEIEAATRLQEIFGEKIKVNLDHPEVSIGVEVRDKIALVYYETFKGPGGLPEGTDSLVLALLSGGIDSSGACHMTMKRGFHVDFLTFHSFPYTPMESVDKVKRLASVLNRYQKKGRLYSCNISELQKLIRDNCNPRYRTILYRRQMMRIAEKICRFQKLNAIVTGESVGQVASQTIVNLSIINDATRMLILPPLAGLDKLESIERAEKIGTYNISIEALPDSCTVFAPPSPAVAAKFYLVEEEEKKIPDLEEELEKAFRSIEKYEDL